MVFVFLCLRYFTQNNRVWVHPCCCKWNSFILFHSRVIFHCVGTTSSLSHAHLGCFHCLSYCKQCCNEHWGACMFSNYGFLQIYSQKWDCWITWQFQFLRNLCDCSPQWLYQFTFPPVVWEGSLFSTPSPAFIAYRFFGDGHSDWCEVIPHNFDLRFSQNQQH